MTDQLIRYAVDRIRQAGLCCRAERQMKRDIYSGAITSEEQVDEVLNRIENPVVQRRLKVVED
jgi:hypothetical protein